MKSSNNQSTEVTKFLNELNHPLRKEIETLRLLIFNADANLQENIKWNGPNYSLNGEDRITMKIQPPKQIQLIFHRGAKVLAQPADKLVSDPAQLLDWKTNDRAVAGFKTAGDIEKASPALTRVVKDWLEAAK